MAETGRSGESYLVRLGSPAKGDTIHVNTCRHATALNALRWVYADKNDWEPSRTPWLRCCKRCHPEEWMALEILRRDEVAIEERAR